MTTAKDVLVRAFRTFWQTGLAFIIINIGPIVENVQELITDGSLEVFGNLLLTIGLGALSAGLSAAYNGVIRPLADKLKAADAKKK